MVRKPHSVVRRASVLLLVLGVLTPGTEAPARGLPKLDRIDPIRYAYEDAIVEREVITARDGLTTLALDLIRPPTATRVPTILLQSPYYNTLGRGYRHELKTPWLEPSFPSALFPVLGAGGLAPKEPFPEWYDEYFVPRGYAVVLQDQRGTRNSSGCQVYGGREEVTDAVDVIDWIARQPWSNGAVGMTGGSYDGTVAIGAATMAPPALKAIIPIRAIDRWYDYHFFNGVQSADHLATPWSFTSGRTITDTQNSGTEDLLLPVHVVERKACAASIGALVAAQYSLPVQDARADFWAQRDYLIRAQNIRAATFIIHGLDDANVKPMNAGNLWAALPKSTPKALWWFRGGHADPAQPEPYADLPFPFNKQFIEATHRWFAEFLKGLAAGAREMPPVRVQGEKGAWWDATRWPPPAKDQTYFLGQGVLSSTAVGDEAVLQQSEELRFVSSALPQARRLAGQSYVRLTYVLPSGGDVTFAATLLVTRPDGRSQRIASGWARGAYRAEIVRRGPSWPTHVAAHMPGEVAVLAFPLWHHDVVIRKGERLVLVLSSGDDHTDSGTTGTEVLIALNGQSKLVVPVASGRGAQMQRARLHFQGVPFLKPAH